MMASVRGGDEEPVGAWNGLAVAVPVQKRVESRSS